MDEFLLFLFEVSGRILEEFISGVSARTQAGVLFAFLALFSLLGGCLLTGLAATILLVTSGCCSLVLIALVFGLL